MARPKKNIGRPPKEIDPALVEKLAAINCSYAEIAAVLDCDPKTLSNRFSQAIKKGRKHFRMSLKRRQYELAMGGNATMLIWLGKVALGQRERKAEQDDRPKDGPTDRVVVYLPDNGRRADAED